MWILSFVPDAWLYYAVLAILLIGAVAFIIGEVMPKIFAYKEPLKIFGILFLIAGVYFYGSYETEIDWRSKTAEMQKEIDEAKVKSDDANKQIAGLIAQKTQVIHDKQIVIQKQIIQDAAKIDKQCVVDPEVITIINNAASDK